MKKKIAVFLMFMLMFTSFPVNAFAFENKQIAQKGEQSTSDVEQSTNNVESSANVKDQSTNESNSENDDKSLQNKEEKDSLESKAPSFRSMNLRSGSNQRSNFTLLNPVNNQKLTGDFCVKGNLQSKVGGKTVEVFVDGALKASKSYEASETKFQIEVKGVQNGTRSVKVKVSEIGGQVSESTVSILVDNTKTPIMGSGKLTKAQMAEYLVQRNSNKSYQEAEKFVDYTIQEAKDEGVNHDILYSQMMLETNFLKFGGDVKPEQNNFAGLGATGNGVPGESFKDVQTGIRAVVQHLKAYASSDKLNKPCVDNRFHYVTRSSAPYVEYLGIQENPTGAGWAAGRGYGYNIIDIRNKTQNVVPSIPSTVVSKVTSFKVTGNPNVNSTLTLSAEGSPAGSTLYKLWVCDKATDTWTVLSDYSTKKTANYVPKKAGNYRFVVHVKGQNKPGNEEDDYKFVDMTIKSSVPSKVTSFKVTGNPNVNSTLTLSAEGTPADSTLYKLWVCDKATNTWTVLSDYSTKKTANYVPKKAGNYRFVVHVKANGKPGTVEDDYKFVDMTIKAPVPSKVTSFKVTGTPKVNSTLTLSAEGTPADSTLYKLWVCDKATDTWTVLSDYSTKKTVNYVPKKAGNYRFVVHVKANGKPGTVEDDYKFVDMTVKASDPSKVTSFKVTGTPKMYSTLTLSAEGTPADSTLYKLWVCDKATNKWTVLSDYSTRKTVNYVPTKAGNYRFVVHVKSNGKPGDVEDDYKYVDLNIAAVAPSKVTNFKVTGVPKVNSPLTLSAEGTPADSTLYKLWVCDKATDKWTVLSDYSTRKTVDYVPTKAGNYRFVVHVKSKDKPGDVEDDYKYIDMSITDKTVVAKVKSFDVEGTPLKNSKLTLKAEGTPETYDSVLYKLWVCDRSTDKWTVLSDYSTRKTIDYTPQKSGKYRFVVHVKGNGKPGDLEDDYKAIDVVVTDKPVVSKVTSFNVTGDSKVGSKLTLKAEATPNTHNSTLYKLWVCDRSTDKWTVLSDYSTRKTVDYTPQKSGKYRFVVHVKGNGKPGTVEDDYKYVDMNITQNGQQTIVVDAGHGGVDGGASANGVFERDVALAVSLKLGRVLESKGFNVVYTRTSNSDVPWNSADQQASLRYRYTLANNIGADLFIAVHCNSATATSARGTETYYCADKPSSRGLADLVQTELIRANGLHNRGVKTANFAVIKHTTMPAVLTELGFVTNSSDAALLKSSAFQQKCADGIAKGILRYTGK